MLCSWSPPFCRQARRAETWRLPIHAAQPELPRAEHFFPQLFPGAGGWRKKDQNPGKIVMTA
jgi:hypothetical protein